MGRKKVRGGGGRRRNRQTKGEHESLLPATASYVCIWSTPGKVQAYRRTPVLKCLNHNFCRNITMLFCFINIVFLPSNFLGTNTNGRRDKQADALFC